MIVAKFGGGVLDGAQGLRRVCGEIRVLPKPLLVVTSAFANVTNMLERLAESAVVDPAIARERLDAFVAFHSGIARDVLSSELYHAWVDEVRPFIVRLEEVVRGLEIVRELSARTLDLVVHFGERFSSSLLLAALASEDAGERAVGISALDVVITDAAHRYARPDLERTGERVEERLRPLLAGYDVVVTEGYIARSTSGEATTMGRESSDYTTTMLAAFLEADEARIYRALPGIMTADPRVVSGGRTLGRLSYRMANALAELGSQVLHPRTVMPVERCSIPLVITAIGGPGTTIGTIGEGGCSITLLPEAELLEIETETANAPLDGFLRALGAGAPVIWHHRFRRRLQVLISGHYSVLTLPLRAIAERVQSARYPVAVVSLVREEPFVGADLERFFAAVGGRSPRAIQGGLDGHSISVALDRDQAHEVARELHRQFIEEAEGAERWQTSSL